MFIKLFITASVLSVGTLFAVCSAASDSGKVSGTEMSRQIEDSYVAKTSVSKDQKFGSAILSLTDMEFEAIGFSLGDSCNIAFDNGYTIEDVPFYNGYYVKNGMPIVVAYPGYKTVSITYNNEGIWDKAGLEENTGVTITLNTKGKYSAMQEALGQIYSFDRNDYTTDEEFCNFRALSGGKLKADFLFRGASPVDNSRGRAAYTDSILKQNGISFIVDLADSDEDMKAYMESDDFSSAYSAVLYENGQIALLDMGSAYQSESYQKKVVEGLRSMLNSDGKVYIHCMEGKDRTGFVCTLIEALAGASYDEMLSDYMITYRNYYSVDKTKDAEKYDAITKIYFDAFVEYLHGTSDKSELKGADYTENAKDYLRKGGMTDKEIQQLIEMITE